MSEIAKIESKLSTMAGENFRNCMSKIAKIGSKLSIVGESFRNLSEPTTGEVLVTHQPVRKSFYDLIEPIFSNKTGIDSTVYKKRDGTAKDIGDIIEKEENFLKRFYYEYFSMNIGTATYIGTGSSIKKTSSDAQSLGTAYKIYGCGIFMNKAMTTTEIIIPLETVIVMPN